jgi:beta-phosphoglucomutase-like phosphatase (HAD superfamily)
MGTESVGTAVTEERAKKNIGLVFELEYSGIAGRAIIFDVMKNVLSDRGVSLTPALFSQFCIHGRVDRSIHAVLAAAGKTRISEDKVVQEVSKATRLSLADGSVGLAPGIHELLSAAHDKGLPLGALSSLDEDSAQNLISRLGLADLGVHLHCYPTDSDDGVSLPDADAWRKLTRRMGVSYMGTLVLASSRHACQAAMVNGMCCVAVPDPYTGFQDFSGADFVVDTVEPGLLDEMLALVTA